MAVNLDELVSADYVVVLVDKSTVNPATGETTVETVAVDFRNLKMSDAVELSRNGGQMYRVLKGAPRVVQNPRGPRKEETIPAKEKSGKSA